MHGDGDLYILLVRPTEFYTCAFITSNIVFSFIQWPVNESWHRSSCIKMTVLGNATIMYSPSDTSLDGNSYRLNIHLHATKQFIRML
jgi:hypothetical protein